MWLCVSAAAAPAGTRTSAPLASVNAGPVIAVSLNERDHPRPAEHQPRPTAELLSRKCRSTTALFDATGARTLLDAVDLDEPTID